MYIVYLFFSPKYTLHENKDLLLIFFPPDTGTIPDTLEVIDKHFKMNEQIHEGQNSEKNPLIFSSLQ